MSLARQALFGGFKASKLQYLRSKRSQIWHISDDLVKSEDVLSDLLSDLFSH